MYTSGLRTIWRADRFPGMNRLCALIALVLTVVPGSSLGHGGVVLEDDLCVIKVGFFQAHFTIFQPIERQHQQFCEDIPGTGETIFVLEYLHDGLEQLPVDFRVIQNVTNLGLFASWEDVESIGDLDAITVFYQPPLTEPDVFGVIHNFDVTGDFIGIVTATDPETDITYRAVFPFSVGMFQVNGEAVGLGIVLLAGVGLLLWRRRSSAATPAAAMVLALLSLPAPSAHAEGVLGTYTDSDGRLTVEVVSTSIPPAINQMQSWEITIFDQQGQRVTDAEIAISGGMPLHDHGLPTKPRARALPDPGTYLLEGLKFHMNGAWQLQLQIRASERESNVIIDFNL